MKAKPAEVDLLGAVDPSSWGKGAVAVASAGPFVRDRRILPLTAPTVLLADSGVLAQGPARLGRLTSGVSDTDLALPCEKFR
jgi:hypothetical protein